METALAAIARIKQSAQALGVQDEVSQQIVEAVKVNQVGVNQSVDQPVIQKPTAEVVVQPVVEDPIVEEPTQEPVPEPREVDGEALIGHKVITPEGLTGLAARLEPLHKDMIMVEFSNGSSPYYKGDLITAIDQTIELSPRPDRFYYQQPSAQAQPQVQVNDWVQIYSGEICQVLQVKDIGGRLYVEVKTPEGRKEAFRDTDLKALTKEEVEARQSILPTPPAPKKPKAEAKQDPEIQAQQLGQQILGKDWEDIRTIAKECPKSLREAGLAARTKNQKKWVEELPRSIADFILSSDDDSDLTWLPNHIKQRVQVLLQEAKQAAA